MAVVAGPPVLCLSRIWKIARFRFASPERGFSMGTQRRPFADREKVAILKRRLIDKVPVSDPREERDPYPNPFHDRLKNFFDNGRLAFAHGRPGRKAKTVGTARQARIEQPEAKLPQKDEVMAELMEAHPELKKVVGSSDRLPGPSRHPRPQAGGGAPTAETTAPGRARGAAASTSGHGSAGHRFRRDPRRRPDGRRPATAGLPGPDPARRPATRPGPAARLDRRRRPVLPRQPRRPDLPLLQVRPPRRRPGPPGPGHATNALRRGARPPPAPEHPVAAASLPGIREPGRGSRGGRTSNRYKGVRLNESIDPLPANSNGRTFQIGLNQDIIAPAARRRPQAA